MFEVEAYARLAGVYDEIVVDPCYASWAEFLHDLWSADGISVRRILDVCCGTGLMTAELLAAGHEVVGIDASEAMLARARDLLGPDVVLERQVLPDLAVAGEFDAAVSTFDGLNYLTPDDFTRTMAAVAGCLRPGGWLVFDLHTDAMLDVTIANPVIEGETDGNRFVITSDVDVARRICDARIAVTRGSDSFAETHRQYFHTDGDVRTALHAAGFDAVAVTDEYTDEPVGPATLRATWIARRADA